MLHGFIPVSVGLQVDSFDFVGVIDKLLCEHVVQKFLQSLELLPLDVLPSQVRPRRKPRRLPNFLDVRVSLSYCLVVSAVVGKWRQITLEHVVKVDLGAVC